MTEFTLFDGKVCTKCKEWKGSNEFSKSSRLPSGLNPWCKFCHAEYKKASHPPRGTSRQEDATGAVCIACKEHKPHEAFLYFNQKHGRCHACLLSRRKERKLADPDAWKAYVRSEYLKHRGKILANARKYRLQDPEKFNERTRKYVAENRDIINAKDRQSRKENPDKFREKCRKYGKMHPEKCAFRTRRRRSLQLGIAGFHTLSEWLELCEKYENKCLCCGNGDVKLTYDHIVPISHGGTDSIDNAQPLCKPCNSRKRDRTIDYRPEYQNVSSKHEGAVQGSDSQNARTSSSY